MSEKISIIVPLYNTELYIKETIESVINQTYQNWELIVVDDGSTDGSAAIVQSFVEIDPRISLISKENTGVSNSRNIGIEKATGELIAFLDSDDFWHPVNLEAKHKVITEKDLDFVYCDANLVNENSKIIGEALGNDTNIHGDFLQWVNSAIQAPCSNCIIKMASLNGLRFDEKFSTAADQDFIFYLSEKNKGIRIKEKYLNYRVLANSMSRNISVMEIDHIGVYKKAARNNLFKGFWHKQKCFSNLYLILAGSWWKNGNNKTRGLFFILKAVLNYPPTFFKLFSKSLK